MSNTNSIDNQYDSVAYQFSEQKRAQRRGDERIALTNHTSRRSALGQDIVLPASPEKGKNEAGKGKQGAQKPTLPASKKSWDGLNKGQDLSVVFLLGRIMALEAKKNTDYWTNLWKMGSLNMKMGITMGGVLGTVAKDKWDEQAAALRMEKDMAFQDAFAYLMGFGGSAFAGGKETYKEYKKENATKKPSSFQKENSSESNPAQSSATAQTNGESSSRAEQKLSENNLSKTDKAKRTAKSMGKKAKKAVSTMNKYFKNAGDAAEKSKGMTMLYTRLNDTHYKGLVAFHQGQAGIANALEQTTQQFGKYYAQGVAKSDEVRGGVQQNITKSMNILKTIVDQLSSSVAAMFRG